MMRSSPPDLNSTAGAGCGSGSAAMAMSAAIFGVAALPSCDQPACSRTLTKRTRRAGVAGELAEKRRLLRARDDHVVAAAERRLERPRVPAAKLVVHGERLARFQRRAERFRIERDGAVAAADLKRLSFQVHRLSLVSFPRPRAPACAAASGSLKIRPRA